MAITNALWAQPLSYYLPDSISYNPSIPKPADVIGHEVGEWHVTHDKTGDVYEKHWLRPTPNG
jgi:hypothetical protein